MPFSSGHALVIGLGDYQYMSQHNVPIAAKDAEAVSATLLDASRCGYPSEQVRLLRSGEATRTAVLAALDGLAGELTAESTLFLFYVGHGVYGTDGNYYLTTYDTQLQGSQVEAGTGVSELELLDRLRKIPAGRMLLIINSCHSGELSPSFDTSAPAALATEPPPQKLMDALLSTGEGRITITACRPEQKSWIGSGSLSIFTKAVVGGLRGEGYVPNNNGYISAFGLYEHVYAAAKEAAEALGQEQEPELTVLKGVGPFPVALYRGATEPANFDASEPPPEGTAARQVDPSASQRVYQRYQATLTGSGAIALGPGAVAAGQGGIAIGGNVSGSNIVTGDGNVVGNRSYNVKGGIHAGRDVVMGDQVNNYLQAQRTSTVASADEFMQELKKFREVIEALKTEPNLDSSAARRLTAVDGDVEEALDEARKEKPSGQRISSLLDSAKETMEKLGGTITAAMNLAVPLANLALLAAKVFGG